MGRIVEQLRAVGARRAALFVVITAAVAVGFYFGVREAGVGPRTEAGVEAAVEHSVEPTQQNSGEEVATEPLTLTLSAPEICETTQPQEYGGAVVRWDEAKNDWTYTTHSNGWSKVGEVAVVWAVDGGAGPYTLVIDGETRDADKTYEGPSGTASVSCALQFGETFITDEGRRRYRTEPEVDSGLKTIRATVTNAAGATAEAVVDVYVILALGTSGDILQGGKTYRVMGTLLTVPDAVDHAILGGIIEGSGGGGPLLSIGIADGGWVLVRQGDLREHSRSTRVEYAGDGAVAVGPGETELDALIGQLMESVGQLPSVERAGP